MGCECWNSVVVYGRAAEIERFRRLCIELPPGSNPRNMQGGWGGCEAEIGFMGLVPTGHERTSRFGTTVSATNYREWAPEPGTWSFAFDTRDPFPEDVFEELASLFPALHFHCECIDSMDDYMGFGWFNVPPGGEAFRQDLTVPNDFWTNGGSKQTPAEEAKDLAIAKALAQAARKADRDSRDFLAARHR